MSLFFPSSRLEKKNENQTRKKKNAFLPLSFLTMEQMQRVLRDGPAAVQRLRREGACQGLIEPDVADEPSGGGVEHEASRARGSV